MSNDREIETYLQGQSDLSALYKKLPATGLPDHLDAAILAEAHRAVDSRPSGKTKRRWTIPLSMVATLFIAVMIGLQLPYMLKDAAYTQAPVEVRSAVAEMDQRRADGVPEKRLPVQAPLAAKAEAPALSNVQEYATPRPSPALTGSAQSPASQNIPKHKAMPQAAPVAAPAPSAAVKSMAEHADSAPGEQFAKEKKALGRAADDISDSGLQRAPAAARLKVPEPDPAQQEIGVAQALKDEVSAIEQRPEAWLDRIKSLRKQGKLDEANRELAAFKKRYPDYPVAEKLNGDTP